MTLYAFVLTLKYKKEGVQNVQNQYIADDTKVATRQSPNCIKKKINKIWQNNDFSIKRMEFSHPAMWHDHDTDFDSRLLPVT